MFDFFVTFCKFNLMKHRRTVEFRNLKCRSPLRAVLHCRQIKTGLHEDDRERVRIWQAVTTFLA